MKIGTNDISKIYLGGSEISKIMLGTNQVYSGDTPTPPTPTPYDEQYLTIESTSDNNTIYWINLNQDGMSKLISVSTDNGSTWTEYGSSDERPGTAIATLNTNDKLLLKGTEEAYEKIGSITSTSSFIVYGNIMSLLYEDVFVGRTTLSSPKTFTCLFWSCPLTSAENLILPATTLASECYYGMFYGCTSLTTAPELPATTLDDYCYAEMFSNCSSLNYIKCLATDISATDCTYGWVTNVAASGTFVKAASMNDWEIDSDNGIPFNWTVQNDDGSTPDSEIGSGDEL